MMKKNEMVALNIFEPQNGNALLDLVQIVSHVGIQSNLVCKARPNLEIDKAVSAELQHADGLPLKASFWRWSDDKQYGNIKDLYTAQEKSRGNWHLCRIIYVYLCYFPGYMIYTFCGFHFHILSVKRCTI